MLSEPSAFAPVLDDAADDPDAPLTLEAVLLMLNAALLAAAAS
ncbi:MAG: hypothetical protein ACP5M1_09390 [Acidiphilium sp.]